MRALSVEPTLQPSERPSGAALVLMLHVLGCMSANDLRGTRCRAVWMARGADSLCIVRWLSLSLRYHGDVR